MAEGQSLVERGEAARLEVIAAMTSSRATQQRIFEECVLPNVDTAFGREHRFSEIRGIDDFRRLVPIRDYDGLAPWIERAAGGEKRVLTAADPIAFHRTSGTTSASKKVPVTPAFQRVEALRVFASVGVMHHHHPELFDGDDKVINFTLPAVVDDSTTAGGTRLTTASARIKDPAYRGISGTLAPWFVMPPGVKSQVDIDYYRALVAACHEVRGFIAVNPSTLVVFAQHLADRADELLDELRRGTVRGVPSRAPQPARADQLATLAARDGALLPAHMWPTATYVATWTGGACTLYLPSVRAAFGAQIEIAPLNSLASEGTLTQMIDGGATPLAIHCGFFEFLPLGVEAKGHPETLLYDQLEVGGEYQMVMTQLAGLYRYAIGDHFKVVGRFQDVPRLEFNGRSGVGSSFTGEKLTGSQVSDAISRAVERCAVRIVNVTCCPVWGEPPHYAFVVEGAGAWAPETVGRLATALDDELGRHNEEYPAKRSSNRLGPAVAHQAAPGTFAKYRQELIAAGTSAVQLKERVIQTDATILERLRGLSGGWLATATSGPTR